MPAISKLPIPDSRLPFVNAEFAQIQRNGKPWLVTSVWGGEDNGRIFLIDPEMGHSEMRRLPEREPGAYMLQTGPDGRLYLGSGWGNLYRYDPRSDQFATLVKGQMSGIVWGGCVTKQFVIWSANPGHACVYDWREEKLRHVLKPLDTDIPAALYGHRVIECPDGKVLLGMNSPQARIIVLDAESGQRKSITPGELKGTVWSRDATFFNEETLALFNPAELLFFHYPSFEFIKKVAPPADAKHMGGRACFCGKNFYALSEGTLWRLNSAQNGWDRVRRDMIDTHGVLWPLNERTLCAIDVSGTFCRLNVENGELFKHEIEAAGPVGSHALVAAPTIKKIFGAPFINQRFWEIDLQSGKGRDLGRASVGGGQINGMLWDEATRRVLMASYTTCTVTAFDPEKPANWPDNPRVLARVLEDQMRPKSFVHDGRYAWMASSAEYGHLGGALSRIDPRDGSVRVWRNLVHEQTPNRIVTDAANNRVYVSTEIYADCQSAPATQKTARLVSFDTTRLAIDQELAPLEECPELYVLALLEPGRVLVKGAKKLFAWEPACQAFDLIAESPEHLTHVVRAPDGSLYTSANGGVGRLSVSRGAVRFDALDSGESHLLCLEAGHLWYIVGGEVRSVQI